MDFQALGAEAAKSDSNQRPIVKGRVLQYDADFAAYECAFLDEPITANWKQLRDHLEVKRVMAGAEFINVHITVGLKGGRDQIATVKPYQEQRDPNLPIKVRVRELRNLLANYTTANTKPVVNQLQEADDSMAQYQVKAIAENKHNLSVIMSGDKDLWMVAGLHCDPKTGEMYDVKGYGFTEYKEVGNVKPKLVGRGTSWFWHQMLMGDKADNIPGLPMLSGRLANEYIPTKKFNPKRKALPCGEAKAVAILKDAQDDHMAYSRVAQCYQDHYGTNWKEMFIEQAYLLWMRRTSKLSNVLDFLDTCYGRELHKFSEAQLAALQEFKKLAKLQLEQGK